jgi:hypothetical protein
VKTYIFQPNQQVLLDEHYFLDKNQKLAAKYSGPHLITKLKGNCNVELLLANGKFAIVHVNRLKPYLSHVNDGQKFSKQGRDCRSKENFQKVLHEQVEFQKPPLVVQDQDEFVEDEFTDAEEHEEDLTQNPEQQAQQMPTPSRERLITRRLAREQGLVYNKDKMQFEPQSTSDTIEALRLKHRLVKRRIKRKENYFVVEHVYQAQQVKPYTKLEAVEIQDTEIESEDDPDQGDSSDTKTMTPSSPETKTIDFLTTPNKTVRFDPNVQRQEFHTPVLIQPKKAKDTESLAGFAKEVIKSTADALFPSLKTETYSPDSRPIRGTTKSYAEMFPDPLVKTEGSSPENKATGHAYNTRSQQALPGPPPPPPPDPGGDA